MAFDVDPERLQATLTKSLSTSFGLTLVMGLPFAQPILDRAARLADAIDDLLPGLFCWYEPNHLHATMMAPLRGQYREGPPLQGNELPADLDGFAETLNDCFAALPPFPMGLETLHLATDGRMLAFGADPARVRQRVAECLALFSGLDSPKDLEGWHVALGYLQSPTPFATEAEQTTFEAGWAKLQASSLGSMVVDRVWLVHYADRRLRRIVGRAPLLLGRPNALTADSLLVALGIGQG
jgi:hypothetical protein